MFHIQPFFPFIYYNLKVASRCNLNCDYCYIYQLADQTWRSQPKFMTAEVWQATAQKIVEHALIHEQRNIAVVIHGGEPLLLGRDRMAALLHDLSSVFYQHKLNVDWSVQTNGVLLDQDWINLFAAYNVPIGVSIDGDEKTHDEHRKDHSGRGSYSSVQRAISLLQSSPSNKRAFGGILSVINIKSDPLRLLNHFINMGISNLDFLLPDSNHDNLPAGKQTLYDTNYGDWLIKMFDAYIDHPNPELCIRIFDILIGLILGYTESIDAFSPNPIQLAVIQPNGNIEAHDAFKASVETNLGLNISHNSFDEAAGNYLIRLQHAGVQALSEQCRACKHVRVCNGGYLPHRYSLQRSFDNPSVYCSDIFKLLDHIRNYVQNLKTAIKSHAAT